MTDQEFALKIYSRIFSTESDYNDAYIQGILDMIGTLKIREQVALKSYYRTGNTYKQTGKILSGISGEAARKLVNKALLKLRHPSRSRNMSIKSIVYERDNLLEVIREMRRHEDVK